MRLILFVSFLSLPFLFFSCTSNIYNVEVSDIRELTDFNEDLAGVLVGDYWGFINTNGDFVIEPQYRNIRAFNDKLAAVQLNNKWGYIDTKGNMIIPAQYEDAKIFSENYAPVKQGNRWGFIKDNGNLQIDFQFDDALPFSDGLAAVQVNGQWGYIKKNGKYKIEPRFSNAGDFVLSLAPVLENGQWGFINQSGEYKINPIFEAAQSFSLVNTGNVKKYILAAVNDDGNWGYIDTKGIFVINPKYDDALPFSDEVAWVKSEDKWGLIDRKDNLLVDFNYEQAGMFGSGLGLIIHNGKKYYIDKKGKDAGVLKITAYMDQSNENLNTMNDDPVLTPYVGGIYTHPNTCATFGSVLGIYNFLDDKILINCDGYFEYLYNNVIIEPKSTLIPKGFDFPMDREVSSNITLSVFTYDTLKFIGKNPGGTTEIKSVASNKRNCFLTAPQGFYKSTNSGSSWSKIEIGLKSAPNKISFSNEKVFVASMDGAFSGTNYGESGWKPFGLEGIYVSDIYSYKDDLYACTPDELFYSKTSEPAWESIYKKVNGYPSIQYVNDTITYMLVNGEDILYSTPKKESWTKINSPIKNKHITDLLLVGDKLFASTFSGIFCSTNFGEEWTNISNNNIWDIAFTNNKLIACGYGVYISEDLGKNWETIYTPKDKNDNFNMTEYEGTIYFYGMSNNIYQTPGIRKFANVNYYTTLIKQIHKSKPLAHLKTYDLISGNKTVFYKQYSNNSDRISSATINALFTQTGNINIWAQALNMQDMGNYHQYSDKFKNNGFYNPMVVILEKRDFPFVPKY